MLETAGVQVLRNECLCRSDPSVCGREDVCGSLGCVVLGMTAVLGC